MARALVVIFNEEQRRRAADYVAKAPIGTRVEFKGPKRTLPQNAKLHAMLTDIAEQVTHYGRRYKTDVWKKLILDQLRAEQEMELDLAPSLYNDRMVVIGDSSSDLTIHEMSEAIELMYVFGAEQDVKWSDPAIESYDRMRTR